MPTMKAKKARIKLVPMSRKQKMLSTWWVDNSPVKDHDVIIADGSIRSGKTMIGGMSYIMWIMYTFDGKNFGVAGKSLDSLKRNVWVPLQQWFVDVGIKVVRLSETSNGYILKYSYYIDKYTEDIIDDGELLSEYTKCMKQLQNDYPPTLSASEFVELLPDHLQHIKRIDKENYIYLFGGKDEGSASYVQGFTAGGFYFDEVALQPESFVNQAVARCSEEGHKIWFNCNPEGPYHWFKQKWIDQLEKHNALRIRFKMEDNPSLSEKTLTKYKNRWDGIFYQRFILGEWVMPEGLVYPMYLPALHNIKTELIPKAYEFEEVNVSLDYGTANPFVLAMWGLKNGTHYMIKSYRHDGKATNNQKTDEEYYVDLVEFCKGYKINLIIPDPSALSFITLIKKKGQFRVKPADNAKNDGIRDCSTCIKQGKFKFNESGKENQENLAEFTLYRWDEKAALRGEDEPLKIHDHFMDAFRYYVRTMKIAHPKFKRLSDSI